MIIHSPIISGSLTFANGATFNAPASSEYSGSFSGSFIGDGSSLTGVTSYTDADTLIYINSRGVLSSSAQLTTEFDTRYLNTESDGIVSASGQIDGTSILNNSLTIAGTSVALGDTITFATITNGTGTISQSAQLTTEFDTRYLNTNGDGIISQSSQVDADSITNFDSNVLAYNNILGVISSSAQLTTEFDTRYLNTESDGIVSASGQIDGTSILNNSLTIAGTSVALGDTITFATITNGTGTISGSDQLYETTDDITEGSSNLYYTDTRVKTKLNTEDVVSGSQQILDLVSIDEDNFISNSNTKVPTQQSVKAYITSQIETKDNTDEITEGSSNLYYTDTRVKTKLNAETVISGSSQVVLNNADKTGFDTDDVTEGTNLYYTDARVKTKLTTEDVVSGSASQVRSFLNVENGADVTDTTNVVAALTAGTNVTIGGDGTISSTNTNTQLSTEQVQDIAGPLVATGGTKTGITITYDDVNGDMDFVVATQSDNNFTTTLKNKLDGIEAGADVTDTDNVTAAGALMDSEVDVDIKTLSLPANTTISAFGKTLVDDADASAARTTLGVDAAGTDNSTDVTLAGTPDYITISGQTITRNQIDLTSDVTGDLPISEGGTGASTAEDARSNLGVDAAGTDNSTDVTLAGTRNYITISGQTITRNVIDISDDTNLAVSDTTGQTGINLTLSGDTISGVVSGLETTSDVTFNDVTVSGNLTVSGTTTTVNSNTVNIGDNIIVLNSDETGTPSQNGGIEIERGTSTNSTLLWDESNDYWVAGLAGSEVQIALVNGTYSGLRAQATTAGDVGLGNVTNESKATMFSSPTFTGTVGGVTKSHVGLANVENTALSTYTGQGGALDNQYITNGAGYITSFTNTNQLTTFVVEDGDGTEVTISQGKEWKFVEGTGIDINWTDTSNGTDGDPYDLTITNTAPMTGDEFDNDGTYASLRAQGTTKGDVGLGNVENTALSTYTGNGGALDNQYITNGAGYISSFDITTQTDSKYLRSNANDTATGIITLSNSTASTTKTTGALIVTGGVGISGALNVGGDVVAYASSDERLKDNIELISNPIEKVQSLKGVTWDWNENADELQQSLPNVGVIAQDVEKVLPQLVTDRDNGFKGVDYAKLTGLLIEAIKEQQKQIDELKSKIQ